MAPIIDFLLNPNGTETEQKVYKTNENVTKSTSGETVIEIMNINFEDDFAQDEIDMMLEKDDAEAEAVKLFKTLGMRYGFHELYKAEENHTHKLHQIVTSVFRALPSINPEKIKVEFDEFLRLGIWDRLPIGLPEMLESPRYYPGRRVLMKTQDNDELANERTTNGITKIGEITSVNDKFCEITLDPFENYGKDLRYEVQRNELIFLNNPQRFHIEPTGKYAFEDGLHCSYEDKLVKAKLIEICFQLNKLVSKLNFFEKNCLELQKEAVLKIRSCLNLITFQSGVDRSRFSRSDNVGKMAVNGQVKFIFKRIF